MIVIKGTEGGENEEKEGQSEGEKKGNVNVKCEDGEEAE